MAHWSKQDRRCSFASATAIIQNLSSIDANMIITANMWFDVLRLKSSVMIRRENNALSEVNATTFYYKIESGL